MWFGDGRYLLWSDIPNDRILKWEEETGAVSVFRRPSNYANGNTRDRQGRLLTCEMDAQRLTRTEYDGTITVLAERFEGKRLTGPNDVVVKSDGSIWFSDNGAGIRGNYLGHKAPWELPFRVYRLTPDRRADDRRRRHEAAQRAGLLARRNPALRRRHARPGQRTIQVYDMVDNGTKVANRREFCSAEPGGSDGIRVDTDGNVWCGWSGGEAEDGVAMFAPDGTMIGRILLPERCANVCFGGRSATACSWRRASRSTRSMSRPRGSWAADPRLGSWHAPLTHTVSEGRPVCSDGQGRVSAQEGWRSPGVEASSLLGVAPKLTPLHLAQ